MESTLRRTWAEIDLDALAHNYHKLRERIGADVKFLGVVKADAYGHGSVQVNRWNGCGRYPSPARKSPSSSVRR